jgi:leader peptidase (prepilin peptidase)/N-methyltransferase
MPLVWTIPLLIGCLSGWAVNYLSDVLPVTRQLSKPGCLHCGASFSYADYLFFRSCPNGHARPVRVWLAQGLMLALSVYSFANPPEKIGYWAGMVLLTYFGVVFVIDMEHRLILHPTSVAGSALALTLGAVSHGFEATLWGGLAGLLILLVFYYFGVLFSRMRARRLQAQGIEADDEESLGQGDVILAAVLGLLVGWPLIWFLILISALLGGFISLFLVIGWLVTRRYQANALTTFIPYGPYFILGALLIVYFPALLKALLPG